MCLHVYVMVCTCMHCCRCDGSQQDGASRAAQPASCPPRAPDGEGEDSDSDIDSVIRRAEQAYGQFRAQFADLLDPSQEEELQQMAALGLPTVLITTRVPDYEWDERCASSPAERSGMQCAPSDDESDAVVAKAIECDEDIVSVINNLSAVRLGFAAGMPGPWEAVSRERGGSSRGEALEDSSSRAREDTMEGVLGALKMKAAAFADPEWEAHWAQVGPSMLAQAWIASYPHLPLSHVETVCAVDFLVAAAAEAPETECHTSGEGGVSDSELHRLWWDFYNQWYWYAYHAYSQAVAGACESPQAEHREGEGDAVLRDHLEGPRVCDPAETIGPPAGADVVSGSDDGSCEPFSGWENEGEVDMEEVTSVDGNPERDSVGEHMVSKCVDGGCSSENDSEEDEPKPGRHVEPEGHEGPQMVEDPGQTVPHQMLDRSGSLEPGSLAARWGAACMPCLPPVLWRASSACAPPVNRSRTSAVALGL